MMDAIVVDTFNRLSIVKGHPFTQWVTSDRVEFGGSQMYDVDFNWSNDVAL